MRHFLSLLLILLPPCALAVDITGAGSTFLFPVMAKWADTYFKLGGVKVNYQSIGSGGGIKQIEQRTVDFGASDVPLGAGDLAKHALVQFPFLSGAIVPVVNLENVASGALRLDGPTLAAIFRGDLRNWHDPRIVALNPQLSLPDLGITVVHRSDGSGTTYVWTHYLAKVSPQWRASVGVNSAVRWPTGVGGKGNEGVAAFVKRINGAIGYTELAFAKQGRLTTVRLKNRDRNFVVADERGVRAAVGALGGAVAEVSTDAPGSESWPITSTSFILLHAVERHADRAASAIVFFNWAWREGAAESSRMDYVNPPERVQREILARLGRELRDAGGRPIPTGL